jgi:hypothetical protein
VIFQGTTEPHHNREIARYIIKDTGSLNILIECSFIKNQPGLESWVPEWSTRNSSVTIDYGHATGHSLAEVKFHDASIDIASVELSAIKSCGPIIGTRTHFSFAQLSKWEPPNLLSTFCLHGEPMIDAYCAILICGHTAERREGDLGRPTKAESRTAYLGTIDLGHVRAQDLALENCSISGLSIRPVQTASSFGRKADI